MSIHPNDPSRGCAAKFPQPVGEEALRAARNLANNVHRVNVIEGRLDEIVYRPGDLQFDIRHPVIRWDRRPYQEIFAHGFQARPQGDTPNNTYYNLDHFVHHAGALADPNRCVTHAFISTSLNYAWHPNPNPDTLPRGEGMQIYRYEIYAPGGIWVAQTLRGQDGHQYSEAEVCFVGGIAPQYIRSCLIYTFIRDPHSMRLSFNNDTRLIINGHFNPQAYPYVEVVTYLPIHTYVGEDGKEKDLPEEIYTPRRQKRQVSDDNLDAVQERYTHNVVDAAQEWYTHKVVEVPGYINAAFRSSRTNEAYLFMKNKYVCVNYAPRTKNDKILGGPYLVCDNFPSLIDTPFGEQGIDCAFDCDYISKNEAFIFFANLCAYIDYAPGTTNDKILSGPKTIAAMFPFLKGTVFENGIDAAFTSTRSHEAYLFRGDKYVRINYDSKTRVGDIRKITDGFPSLLGTVFARDIDAAFASHRKDEAYLFKGELYALINFAPGTTDDYIIGGRIKYILSNWPSLRDILPLKNKGLAFHDHRGHEQDHEHQHDENETYLLM